MKILCVGDQHVDVSGPSRRVDKYVETVFEKLSEVREIALRESVQVVILTGDMFDRDGSRVPYWVTNRLVDYFESYPRPIEILTTLGNHDIVGNIESWHRQPIGTVVRAGRVRALWEVPVVLEDRSFSVEFSAAPYRDDSEDPNTWSEIYGVNRRPEFPSVFHLRVVHTMLLKDGTTLPVPFATPGLIEGASKAQGFSMADLYVCGHVHDDLGTHGNGRFVNYGSLTRGTISASDLERKVSVCLLDVGGRREIAYKRIELASMRPASEVFDLAALKAERKQDDRLDRLAAALAQHSLGREFQIVDPKEAAEKVIADLKVEPEVANLVRTYIERSRSALQ